MQRLSNAFLILLSCLVGWIAIDNHVHQRPIKDDSSFVGKAWIGPKIEAPGEKATVVMALQTGCHWCNESMPFYAKLSGLRSTKVHLVAAFPQAETEARAHLAKYSVLVDQIAPRVPDVRGTPTLFLLDAHKVVKRMWHGKLDSAGEAEVLKAIQAAAT